MNMHVKPSKLKVGDRVVEDKSVGGSDLVEHWNEYWKSAGPFEGAFYVTGLLHSGDEVSYSNKPGGNGPICPARYLKPAPLFAVGDRVRVARHCNYKGQNIPMGVPVGEVRKISRKTAQLAKEGIDTFSLDGDDRYFYTPLNLESAPTYTSCAAAEVDNLAAEYGGGKKAGEHKEGDKIRVIKLGNGGSYHSAEVGDVYTVTSVEDCFGETEIHTDGDWYFHPYEIEHVAVAPATAPLTIEAGKFYKTRDGRKVGPMIAEEHRAEWVWRISAVSLDGYGAAWRADGTFDPYEKSHAADLVAEWPSTPTSIADIVARHSATGTAIVCLLENGQPKPSTVPFVHGDAAAAEREASRLANLHKGQEFGVYTLGEVKKVERTFDHEWQRLAMKANKADGIAALKLQAGITTSQARKIVYAFAEAA